MAPQIECEECDPKMGKYVRSSLVEFNEIDPSLIICLQSSHLALVALRSCLPVKLYQALGHLRPNVCTSVLFVASEPCNCRILELSVVCQLSKRTAVKTPVSQRHVLSEGTVAESSVKKTLLSVNMPVNSLSLHMSIVYVNPQWL